MPPQNNARSLPRSCLTCNRRKVKCDRVQPVCGRCDSGGHASTCVYPSGDRAPKSSTNLRSSSSERRPLAPADGHVTTSRTPSRTLPGPRTPSHPTAAHHTSTVDRSAEKVRELEKKMIQLEHLLKRPRDSMGEAESSFAASEFEHGRALSGDAPPAKRATKGESHVKGLLAGKGFRTKYYGASHASSLLAEFPELSEYWAEIDRKYPQLSRLRDPLKAAKQRNPKRSSPATIDLPVLLSLLPNRNVTDKLMTCYLEGLDTIYHVLHVPSFLTEYDQFWDRPSNEPDVDFAVLLFLAMAAVCSVPQLETTSYSGQSSASRNTAVEWIEMGEAWVRNHSQKHITLRYLQTRCLLLIAQRANDYKPRRAWAASGDLLRFAMAAGYHREPGLLKKKTSAYDQEMRRRLWATIMELDLQACLERGMLPSLRVGEWDCKPPSNFLDSELELCRTSDQLPASRAANSFTSCSFLRASQESLALRLELLTLINQLSGGMTHAQVISYDEKLVQTLDELPVWPKSDPEASPELPSHALAQSLLRTQLLTFRLLIHRQSTLSHTPHGRSHYSRTVCLDCASQILIQYESLQQDTYYTMLLFTHDIFRAALSICFDLVQTQGGLHYTGSSQDGGIFIKQAEASLAMLKSKALRLGRGIAQFGITSIACSLAHSQFPNASSISPEDEAADGITELYHHLISAQAGSGMPGEGLDGDENARSSGYNDQPDGEADPESSAVQGHFSSLPLDIDHESPDPFGWSLDDFWQTP